MQVRQIAATVLLAVTAAGAMAQEIDPRDQHITQSAQSVRSIASVRAEVRNLQAQGELKSVGELSEAPVVGTPAQSQLAEAPKTRAQVRAELAQWRASHQMRVGELG